MKKNLIIIVSILAVSACGGPKQLYNWGKAGLSSTSQYEQLTYKNYDKQTPESICALVVMYENLVKYPDGSRQVPPPGICAEYGYLLILPETATTFSEYATKAQKSTFESTDYGTFFREYGLKLMAKEIEFYPEATIFIKPLIERFSNN